MATLPTLPSPEITPESAAFWQATGEGKLLIGQCNACQQPHWYPRAICPFCTSADTGWLQATGRGTIYSCSLVSPAKNPYIIAFVKLAEGPVLMTNIIAENLEKIAIGQAVKVAFAPCERDMSIPVFVPEE